MRLFLTCKFGKQRIAFGNFSTQIWHEFCWWNWTANFSPIDVCRHRFAWKTNFDEIDFSYFKRWNNTIGVLSLSPDNFEWNKHLGLILPTSLCKAFTNKDPKRMKIWSSCQYFLRCWDPAYIKLHCDKRFTHAFTACGSVFQVITLVGSNQGNYFENATACSKRMLKNDCRNAA